MGTPNPCMLLYSHYILGAPGLGFPLKSLYSGDIEGCTGLRVQGLGDIEGCIGLRVQV